jgi:hypothetical protein
MYIHFILYFLRTIKDGLHGTISEIKTQYITIPGTVVLLSGVAMRRKTFVKRHLTEII